MRQKLNPSRNKIAVYADCEPYGNGPIDMHKEFKNKNLVSSKGSIVTANSQTVLNKMTPVLDWESWLPSAAQAYNISADPKDYILLPTIICPADIPNRNGVSFPDEELTKWNMEAHQPVYKAWKGCPTFSEHENEDPLQARGVVLDVIRRRAKGFKGDVFKIFGLAAFDRSKYPDVAQRLLSRYTTTVSMGAYVDRYECGLCGAEAGRCNHINMRNAFDFGIDPATGGLIYRICRGITPFELSEVQVPAWSVSESPLAIDLAAQEAFS